MFPPRACHDFAHGWIVASRSVSDAETASQVKAVADRRKGAQGRSPIAEDSCSVIGQRAVSAKMNGCQRRRSDQDVCNQTSRLQEQGETKRVGSLWCNVFVCMLRHSRMLACHFTSDSDSESGWVSEGPPVASLWTRSLSWLMKCVVSWGGCHWGLVMAKCIKDNSVFPSSACW